MKREQIESEYLLLFNKPNLTEQDLKRSRILVSMWKRNQYWDEYLKITVK